MIIYIAGKIKGDPNYKAKFRAAESRLRALGHTVLNPAWLPENGMSYGQYLNIGFAMLREADAVFLLDDWTDSQGAVAECSAARIMGKKILTGGKTSGIVS